MPDLRVCIDVDDLMRGERFYVDAFGFVPGRRNDAWVELLGAPVPVDLLRRRMDATRHRTPVHLDLVVPDLPSALAKALAAGATLEGHVRDEAYGRIALVVDPFGHGVDIVQLSTRGYDAIAD